MELGGRSTLLGRRPGVVHNQPLDEERRTHNDRGDGNETSASRTRGSARHCTRGHRDRARLLCRCFVAAQAATLPPRGRRIACFTWPSARRCQVRTAASPRRRSLDVFGAVCASRREGRGRREPTACVAQHRHTGLGDSSGLGAHWRLTWPGWSLAARFTHARRPRCRAARRRARRASAPGQR